MVRRFVNPYSLGLNLAFHSRQWLPTDKLRLLGEDKGDHYHESSSSKLNKLDACVGSVGSNASGSNFQECQIRDGMPRIIQVSDRL